MAMWALKSRRMIPSQGGATILVEEADRRTSDGRE
jgi:hypothetical protein